MEMISPAKKETVGKVYLVSAGCGDASLITLRGKELIEQADVILYDRLVDPSLLRYCKEDCAKVYVGKGKDGVTFTQETINFLMIADAMKGATVVRLKGGDGYVFGRGGEEGVALHDANIPFEVVPGVSSILGATAYAGIPLTYRGVTRGFRVLTATDQKGHLTKMNFSRMTSSKETLVFLMGMSHLSEIMASLLHAGMRADMPAAVIEHGASSKQKTICGTISTIAEDAKVLHAPAVIVVGEVVKYRDTLKFFEDKELYGIRILLPRVSNQISNLAKQLKELGADITEIDVASVVECEHAITSAMIKQANWLVFTSANAVHFLMKQVQKLQLDHRVFGNVKFAVVGSKTRQALLEYGFYADLMPEHAGSEQLKNSLEKVRLENDVVYYLKEANVRNALTACEWIQKIELYEIKHEAWEKQLAKQDFDYILFTTPTAVNEIYHVVEPKGMVISIGTTTSKALKERGVSYIEATETTYEGMIEAIRHDRKERL